jgi:hypothetical protein
VTLGLIVVMGMLGILATRTVGPIKAVPAGKELLTVETKFVDRLLLHRFQLMSMLVVLILGSGSFGPRWISQPVFLLGIAGALLLVTVPARHIFTVDGFNLHTSTTRTWKECTRFSLEGRRVVILGDRWHQRATLYMPESARPELERLLKNRGLRPERRDGQASTAKAAPRR